jgi:hypothetical protein
MDKLSSFLDAIVKPRYEEDFVDRINYRATSYLFMAAAITVTAQVYGGGSPVQCWNPAQFQKGWEEYVHDYCLVENTYWLPINDQIPTDTSHRDERELTYYQWVGFLLALQGLMFYIPHVFWRMLNWLSGVQVRAIITMACNPGGLYMSEIEDEPSPPPPQRTMSEDGGAGRRTKPTMSEEEAAEAEATRKAREEERKKAETPIDKTVAMIANHLICALRISEGETLSSSSNPFAWIARITSALFGTYITCTYLFTKFLFIANCLVQFVLLSTFLGTSSRVWGYDLLHNLRNDNQWDTTGYFPRVTLCDFEVRQLGNLHRWTVQCVLILNMLNEKIYLFLWWWILFVTFVTICNFLYWLYVCIFTKARRSFLRRMLSAHGILIDTTDKSAVFDRFESKMIGTDGTLVLRLMVMNAGELIGSAVIAKMWNQSKDELLKKIRYEAQHLR